MKGRGVHAFIDGEGLQMRREMGPTNAIRRGAADYSQKRLAGPLHRRRGRGGSKREDFNRRYLKKMKGKETVTNRVGNNCPSKRGINLSRGDIDETDQTV